MIFDPDYTSKRIPVDLTNVSLNDALRIVGTLAGTFWKPITPNTMFVAQNNRTKRTDLDDLAVQTFYLTNVSQQNDANEVLVALRNLLDPSIKIYLVASQNAIVMRAAPDELILAEKLINDLDRVRPEVVIDVAVLEVSRNKERNLGITLPQSFGLTPQVSNANQTTSTSTGTSTGTGTTSTGDLFHDLQHHAEHARQPERDELRRLGHRRHGERAAYGLRHAHPAEPAHPRHGRPALHHQDRLQDPRRDRFV